MLIVLGVILAFNYADRVALSLVVQSVKADFHLSDTDLGLMTGFAFAIFYSTCGIPIGRWADRGNRVVIIAVTTALWSVMVALSGVARSFGQLLLIRMGVGVGEAGCLPPAYSLIGDHFGREERPRAVANYLLGGSLSVVVGYLLAGWLNQLYGWRVMFAILGCPGLLLSLLSWFTLREPRVSRAAGREEGVSEVRELRLAEVLSVLWRTSTYRYLLVALCLNFMFGYGISQWQPAFFIRSFGLTTGELGVWFSGIYGAGAFVGTYCGGQLASRYAAGNERLQLRVVAALNVTFGVVSACGYLSQRARPALVLIGVAASGGALVSGPLFAATQTVVPERMRALAISILFLFLNLIGMGIGPLLVGALSDGLRPLMGADSLRYALVAMCPGYLLGGWYLCGRQEQSPPMRSQPLKIRSARDPAECSRHASTRVGVDVYGAAGKSV